MHKKNEVTSANVHQNLYQWRIDMNIFCFPHCNADITKCASELCKFDGNSAEKQTIIALKIFYQYDSLWIYNFQDVPQFRQIQVTPIHGIHSAL
jgi:hypothetical protein